MIRRIIHYLPPKYEQETLNFRIDVLKYTIKFICLIKFICKLQKSIGQENWNSRISISFVKGKDGVVVVLIFDILEDNSIRNQILAQ